MEGSCSSVNQRNEYVPAVECQICGELKIVVSLEPCQHKQICIACVSRLDQKICPFCRVPIEHALVSDGEWITKWKISSLEQLAYRNDKMMRGATKQIILVGPCEGKKEVIHKKILDEFGNGECFLLRSPYRPNIEIDRVPLNFKISSENYPQDPSSWYRDLGNLQPDYLLLCLPFPNTLETAQTGQEWVDFLRAVTPDSFAASSVFCQISCSESPGEAQGAELIMHDSEEYEDIVRLVSSTQGIENQRRALQSHELSMDDLLSCITENVNPRYYPQLHPTSSNLEV